MWAHHQLSHFVDLIIAQVSGPQFAQKKKKKNLLSLFSVFLDCNISIMKGEDKDKIGKYQVKRQPTSHFPLYCPTEALRLYFKISRCLVAGVIQQGSMLRCVSSACLTTPARPVTGWQKTCKKCSLRYLYSLGMVTKQGSCGEAFEVGIWGM